MLGNAIVIARESGPGRLRGPPGFASRAQPRERRARGRDGTMKCLYSTSWRFKAMRTPFTNTTL